MGAAPRCPRCTVHLWWLLRSGWGRAHGRQKRVLVLQWAAGTHGAKSGGGKERMCKQKTRARRARQATAACAHRRESTRMGALEQAGVAQKGPSPLPAPPQRVPPAARTAAAPSSACPI